MKRRLPWAAGMLVGGLLASAVVAQWRSQRAERASIEHYRQVATERLRAEDALLQRAKLALDTLQVFFDTVPEPAPRDFAHLTMPLRRTAGVEALFAANPLSLAQRAGFEQHWQAIYPGYAVRYRNFMNQQVISPQQPDYLPLVYATYSQPARLALGTDLFADPQLGFKGLAADDDGYLMSASYRGEGGARLALLMHWRGDRAGRQLLGIALSPHEVLEAMPDGGAIRDYWLDVSDPDKAVLIYPDAYGDRLLIPLLSQSFKLGGRSWRMEARLDAADLNEATAAAWKQTIAAGSAITALLCLLIILWPRRQAHQRNAVRELYAVKSELAVARLAAHEAQRDGVRLRTILDTAGEAMVLIDRLGRIEQFNAAAERMFGYPASEVLRANISLLMPQSAREWQDGSFVNYLMVGDTHAKGGKRELAAQKKGGDAFPVELSLNEFQIDGYSYYVGVIRDMTARKRTERMLFESEYKHRAILDAAHIGIFLLQDGVLRYVNPAFADSFHGRAADFTDSVGLASLVAPAWTEALSVALDPERSGGRPTEVLMQRRDGECFYALVTAKPILYDNRPGLAGSLLDISERKAAEVAMLRAEIRNIAILEAIPDLMLQLGANGVIQDCRARAGGSEFGISANSIGQYYRRGLPAEFADRLGEALAEGASAHLRNFEYQLQGEQGPRDFEARLTPTSDGEWLVMVRDITERKQIEAELIRHRDHLADLVRERTAELDALFNANPLATVFVAQRRFINVNAAFERLFGYDKAECINAPTRLIYESDEAWEAVAKRVYPLLAEGKQTRIEQRFVARDGEVLLCEVLGQATDARNPLAGSVLVFQDIRERRAAENALLRGKEWAEAASRAKSEFLANMSHELRTPMHAVLSFAELGERKAEADPAKAVHYFGRIRSSGQRLLQILNDLLDLSKLEAGKMRYDFRSLQLASVVRDVADEFAPLLRQQSLALSLDVAVADVRADPLRIGQVIRNLVSNAIKFSPPNGTVLVGIDSDERGWVVLTVDDQGVGVPEGELGTIFDKFTQSSKTKTGAGGTGLGLAISREIVDAHAGDIRAENRAEGGARFVVALPPA
jgi:PAS domain S-box-containing protein